MFCCRCGARNPNDANFCHGCGTSLYVADAGDLGHSAENRAPYRVEAVQTEEEQRRLFDELLPIDQKQNECHSCGRTDKLHGWDFGLGKKLSTTRAWGETAWSVAVSA